MKKKLFFALFLPAIIYIVIVLSFFIRSYSTDPEGCLLQALKNHKVLMLGDFCHGAALPHKTVIWLLQRWLDDLKKGGKELRHLTLVLECDSSETFQIKRFIKDGELPSPEVLAINHLEKLEFFADLGRIIQEVESLNNHESENKRICFDILGAEPLEVNRKVHLKMNAAEGVEYFVRKRDILSAERIVEYAKANPEQRFLIFYGNAHLKRGLRNKDLWGFFPDKDLRDHYLIHYLEKSFGQKEVFSADQIDFRPYGLSDSKICEVLTGKNSNCSMVFFSNPFEMWVSNLFSGKRPADVMIVRRTRLVQPIFLSAIPLAGNVRRCLTRLEQLKDETGFLAKMDQGELKKILSYTTGKKAESINEWQAMLNDGKFFSWIEAEKMPEHAKKFYRSDSEFYANLFSKMTASFRKINGHKSEAGESRLLRSLFCASTLWAGDDQEKAFAKAELIKESGIDSSQPGDYLTWIRNKYFLVNY